MASFSPTDANSLRVGDDEYLLRRFANEPDQYDFSGRVPKLSVMLPTKADEDGLSLYRERLVSAHHLLEQATNEKVRNFGGVVAILSLWLRELGLTIQIDQPEKDGHTLVPEMNRRDYVASREGKKRIQALADRIVRLVADHKTVRISPKPKPQI